MASRSSGKVQEGVKHLAAGDKCLQTGFFKWKPDFEGAAQSYKDAANCFKVARAHEEAKSAFVKAAKALESSGSDFHAAKYFEQAAMMAKELKQGEEAARFFQQAGILFRENGSVDTAGIMLDRAGKILEPLDGSKALEMYLSAADLSEDADKLRQATESLAKAIQLMVKYRKFDDCIKAMQHQLILNDKLSNYQFMHKISLSIILVHLCRDDYVAGERYFRDACAIDGFGESDAAALAEELLQAYDSGDSEAMEKTTSDQYFSFISTEIARLARALKGPQDLAPPDPVLGQHQPSSLAAYSRQAKSAGDPARPIASKKTPARAAEDRAALFGEAPQPATSESSHAAPSSAAARETRTADRAQPRATAAKMPAPDERAALFGDSAEKPAAAAVTHSRTEPAESRADPSFASAAFAVAEPGVSATPAEASEPAADAAAGDEAEKLFDDNEFEEGDFR